MAQCWSAAELAHALHVLFRSLFLITLLLNLLPSSLPHSKVGGVSSSEVSAEFITQYEAGS